MKTENDHKQRKPIRLQLAMDTLSLEQAIETLMKMDDLIDIAEVGTPMILEYGNQAVRALRQNFPGLTILADTKIMDGGYLEAMAAFKAGANIITVLGAADDATVSGCTKAAQETGQVCAVDMICVDDLPRRCAEAEKLGAGLIAVHTGVDRQASGATPLNDLKIIQASVEGTPVSVAGGINIRSVKDFRDENPDIVVVGGGILHQSDPVKAARAIREVLDA